ncbi:septum site-determining protein Ssd [Actinokineospora enzanensis]|uniref:septum site-determining protein Ssd n=1 Tax=Actinokineospora enzanensis TaxID=155975 RepID=UPI00035F7DF7|nr:septum site-determining protein Ssd [Actinokineospora enzanensis]
MSRPLICLRDDTLLDEVLRLSAAAPVELTRAVDVSEVRAHWSSAPLVLLDAPTADECASAAFPRRGGVVLVSHGPPPSEIWEPALALGAERVLSLPADEEAVLSVLADASEAPAGTAGRVLAVVGGRGGAGASVFAVAVALSVLEGGGSALLIDCDALGGGLDLVLGAEEHPGLRWPDLRATAGRVPVSSLHSALPGRTKGTSRLTLLSGAREGDGPTPDAVVAVLEAGRRGGETVVCDIPRGLDPAARAALERADLTVVVMPAELRATAAAKQVAGRLAGLGIRASLVVRGPSPGRLHAEDIAAAVGLPLLTTYRCDSGLPQALEHGTFRLGRRAALARAARATLRALAEPADARSRLAA